jgi:hypothetical protein
VQTLNSQWTGKIIFLHLPPPPSPLLPHRLPQGTEVVMSPAPGASGLPKPAFDAVPAPDVPLHIARKNYELAKTEDGNSLGTFPCHLIN